MARDGDDSVITVEFLDTGLLRVVVGGQVKICTEAHFRMEGGLQIVECSEAINVEQEEAPRPKRRPSRDFDDIG